MITLNCIYKYYDNKFQQLNEEGITIIQVTHNEEFAKAGKRIIRLADGLKESDTGSTKITAETLQSWWIFALAGLMALVIALFTVSWQSWQAARRNSVEALRYE